MIKSRKLQGYALAALFFILLALALNYPLVAHLRTHVVGRPYDDVFEMLWLLSAMRRAVFETHSNPFYAANVFYPQGWYMASGAQPVWYLVLLAPLVALAGPVAAYNLAMLSTFAIGGCGVYWVARGLTGRAVPALIAGCAYIVAPLFTLRLAGHTHALLSMMFLPYAVGATLRAMAVPAADRRRARRWTIAAGVALALTILSHWYLLFIATLPLAGLALTTATPLTARQRLGRLLALGAVAAVVVAPFMALTWQARQAMLPGGGTYALADTAGHGFSPDYFLSPNPLQPLWRDATPAVFPIGGEWDVVALGYAAVALAVIGLLTTPWRQTRPLLVMGLVAFVLGLGPLLRWRGQMVELAAPPRLAAALAPLLRDLGGLTPGRVPVLLPGFALYYLLPFYDSVRVWSRYAMPLTLAVALLAGCGAAWLWGRGRGGRAAALALGAVVLFEGLTVPYRDFTAVAVHERAVNDWLAAQPPGTVILEYPLPWVNALAMYSQSFHGQTIVNGNMSFAPTFLAEVSGQLGEWPNAAALPILRDWGVDYVVVSGLPQVAVFRDTIWPDLLALDGLCLVQSFPDALDLMDFRETHVFAVQAPGAACPARP